MEKIALLINKSHAWPSAESHSDYNAEKFLNNTLFLSSYVRL